MNMKKYILIYIIGTFLFSCKDPYEGTTFTAYDEYPISKYLDTRPDDFSLWTELLKYADLYNTFNLYETYTAFIPNDTAMQHYLDSFNYASVSDMGLAEADYLIKYHTLYGKLLPQAEFTNGVIPTPTVTDDNLSITYREGGINEIYVNDYARITELDVEVINGIIHVLDKVLIPDLATVYTRLEESSDYAIMKAAVDATGYDEILDRISEDDEDEDGFPIIKRYYYTLFAVTDDTYNNMGVTSLQDLVDKLGAGANYLEPSNALNKYVAYHILSQLNSSDALGSFEEGQTSKNINTLADKELINLSSSETGTLQINFNETDGSSTTFVQTDIACKNGVVHVVDSWMPIATPPTTVVDWDLANYADLAAICDYFQSASPQSNTTYRKLLPRDEVAAFKWSPVPVSKEDVVTYVNNGSNDGIRYGTLNHDHLRISTGQNGWVEITSPVIVKGTYKLTLHYINLKVTGTEGNMQCFLDGTRLGTSFYTTNSTKEQLSTKVLIESITFDATDSHVLRIVGLDNYLLRLDYIKFEPLN